MRRVTGALVAAAGVAALTLTSGCSLLGYENVKPASQNAASVGDQNTAVPENGQALPGDQNGTQDGTQNTAEPNAGEGVTPQAVRTATNDRLGTVVVDDQGFALYRSDDDSRSPSQSNCVDDCAQTWPPVLANEQLTVEGIDQSLLGSTVRADGSNQLTIGGWPVYRFSGDTLPGETNGEGIGGKFFVVGPDGGKAAEAGAENGEDGEDGTDGFGDGPVVEPQPDEEVEPDDGGAEEDSDSGDDDEEEDEDDGGSGYDYDY